MIEIPLIHNPLYTMYKDGRIWLYAAEYKEEDAKLARDRYLCIWLHLR